MSELHDRDETQELGHAGAPGEASGADHGGRLEHPDRVAGEEPAEDRAPPPAPPIRPSDRCCAVGMTGSGKSMLLAHLWAIYPGQRVLVDVNDVCELGPDALADERGHCTAEKVRDVDWRARTIRFVPRAQNERLYNDLYAAIFDRGNLCVFLDESQGPTTSSRWPQWLRTTVTQGRKRSILHLAATQEPMNVVPVIYSQAEHLFVFRLTGRRDELNALAPRLGLDWRALQDEVEALQPHGYLRHSIGPEQPTRRMPPLPPDVVAYTERHVRWAA